MFFNNFRRKNTAKFVSLLLVLTSLGCSLIPNIAAQNTPTANPKDEPTQDIFTRTPQPGASDGIEETPPAYTSAPDERTPPPSPAADYFSREYPFGQKQYVIPLTVRHVNADRASLFFELDQPTDGMLVYRSLSPEQPARGQVSLDPNQTRHMIDLEGLTPGAAYQVKVLLGTDESNLEQPSFGEKIWGGVDFNTTGEIPLRVGILGDASFGDKATSQLVELMAGMQLDFVIHTGDVVYETDSSDLFSSYLDKFYTPFAPLLHKGPVYTVMGNHDYDASVQWQGAPFYDYAFPPFEDPTFEYPADRRGNQYYAIAAGDMQFLMLDSQAIFGEGGREGQDIWLKERLADPRFRYTIPVFHVSPYSSSIVHPDDGTPVRQSWNYLFEGGHVPLVLSGHFHHYERLSANDITYIVSGGGSSILYAQGAPRPESHIYVPRTHFVLLEVYQDRIELRAISKEGEMFDQATIQIN